MQEAFRRAIEDSPESSLTEKVQQGIRTKELRKLGNKLADLGMLWYQARIDPQTPLKLRREESITKLREIWKRLESQLLKYRQGERMVLLDRVSKGMWISDRSLNISYALIALRAGRDDPLAPASMIFIAGLSDLMGYSPEEGRKFKEFVIREPNSGRIDFPEVLKPVSIWIEQRRFVSRSRLT